MPNFLVITYDSDEQKTFSDHVCAPDANAATTIAFNVRDSMCDCLWHVATYRSDALRKIALELETESAPSSQRALRKELKS